MLIFLLFSLVLLTERVTIFIITSFIISSHLDQIISYFQKKFFYLFFSLIFLIFTFNPELLEKIKIIFYSAGILFLGMSMKIKQ